MCLPDGATSTIKTRDKDGDRRLQAIVDGIGVALGEGHDGIGDGVDLVVMEEAPPGLKGPAIKAIHMVHGAVRLRLIDFGTPYVVINPTTLKAYATGSTSADKTAMAMAARTSGTATPTRSRRSATISTMPGGGAGSHGGSRFRCRRGLIVRA